jgi:hypothetical protein
VKQGEQTVTAEEEGCQCAYEGGEQEGVGKIERRRRSLLLLESNRTQREEGQPTGLWNQRA